MDYISNHLVELLIVVGLAVLAIEIMVLGFSTFILFFVGVALVLTGALVFIGIIPETLLSAILSTAILTAVLALLLWNKLKELQKHTEKKKAKSDLIGMRLLLEQDLVPGEKHYYRFSGVQWELRCDRAVNKGSEVQVQDLEVGIMYVKPV